MKTINRKILRNLWDMKGQAVAIALVIASGVATFIMSVSTMESLKLTQKTFYSNYRFSDIFASLKRAPESLRKRIMDIPGIDALETRVVAAVNLEIEGFSDPVTGHIYSIPDSGDSLLNRLYLREGRLIEPFSDDEIIIGEAFAEAHNYSPGDSIRAIINGRRKNLTITGIALSPEHIYQMNPGALFPDFERYGVMWMGRTQLGTAYDMEGAFNNVVLKLAADGDSDRVIDRLDELLRPYGGLGAISRKDQLSHRYLSEEFRQLEQMASIFPTIFLAVAAFLLNVVISRLVSTQREEIAALKAFGYSNIDVGLHFVKLILCIVVIGVVIGLGSGLWLGKYMATIYMEFYRFPYLAYTLSPSVALIAVFISTAAALLGTIYSVKRAALLPPAQAMRPEPPERYRESFAERMGLKRFFSQPTRMIIRHISRKPVKSFLTVTGIAFACAIMMVGRFQGDALDYMVDVQFGLSQREDVAVTFVEPRSRKALYELQNMKGVLYAEPFRTVPVKLLYQHRSYRTAVQGLESRGELQRLINFDLQPVQIPEAGIVLSDYLGTILGVREGDRLRVEVLEGNRAVVEVPVVALVKEYIGVSAYMEISALNRLMHEGHALSGVYLATDSKYESSIFAELKKMPGIAGTQIREKAIDKFYETMGDTILIFTFINTILAGTIAFGVVYNSARIALSERSRELASLRVLGFSKGEISYILLGELGMLTFAAIPFGIAIGRGMCAYIAGSLQTDLFRVPLILESDTYAFAVTVVLVASIISSLTVSVKLSKLNLIAVLKTKE
jgi:putative ABC transport system permease protein